MFKKESSAVCVTGSVDKELYIYRIECKYSIDLFELRCDVYLKNKQNKQNELGESIGYMYVTKGNKQVYLTDTADIVFHVNMFEQIIPEMRATVYPDTTTVK